MLPQYAHRLEISTVIATAVQPAACFNLSISPPELYGKIIASESMQRNSTDDGKTGIPLSEFLE
jgi:hypothetical protein